MPRQVGGDYGSVQHAISLEAFAAMFEDYLARDCHIYLHHCFTADKWYLGAMEQQSIAKALAKLLNGKGYNVTVTGYTGMCYFSGEWVDDDRDGIEDPGEWEYQPPEGHRVDFR